MGLALLGCLSPLSGIVSCSSPDSRTAEHLDLDHLTERAMDKRAGRSDRALAQARLRALGPEGLEAMRAAGEGLERGTAAYDLWREAMTGVSRQLHADVSNLYWYTDLESAKDAASEQGKPILSLRLLGELDDSFSCANSRLFRTVLYSDPAVSTYLQDNYVLHWSSERPAPRVTIDMGDGRLLQRTITGNSVHYVLDRHGRPVDAFIGLSTPERFLEGLENVHGIALESNQRSGEQRTRLLADYHRAEQLENRMDFAKAMERTGQALDGQPRDPTSARAGSDPIPAAIAMPYTVGKSRMEMPMLDKLDLDTLDLDSIANVPQIGNPKVKKVRPTPADPDPSQFDPQRTGVHWGAIAGHERFALSEPSRRLIRSEHPLDHVEPFPARSLALDNLMSTLEGVVARDSVRNEFQMRPQVHDLFLAGIEDFETLNETIYANVLKTPAADPWLGLVDDSIYMGLDHGGIVLPHDSARVAPGAL